MSKYEVDKKIYLLFKEKNCSINRYNGIKLRMGEF